LRPDFFKENANISLMDLIKITDNQLTTKKDFPVFKAGDTITVHYKIVEGNKERIQQYRGVVLQRRGTGMGETFTVRKMSGNVGVERIFPVNSPFIDKIEVNKYGRVRRARIFYFRGLTGKKARIQERRIKFASTVNDQEENTQERNVKKD
jgi:large subunit ribosomal protein L19